MICSRVVDADEVHLGHGAHDVVVAHGLGGVLVERPVLPPLLDPEEGTLKQEPQAVAGEVDDVHVRW